MTDWRFPKLNTLIDEDFPFHSQSYTRKPPPSCAAMEAKNIPMGAFDLATILFPQGINNYMH